MDATDFILTTRFGAYSSKAFMSGMGKELPEMTDEEVQAHKVLSAMTAADAELTVEALDLAYNLHRREGSIETAAEYQKLHKRAMEMCALHQATYTRLANWQENPFADE